MLIQFIGNVIILIEVLTCLLNSGLCGPGLVYNAWGCFEARNVFIANIK